MPQTQLRTRYIIYLTVLLAVTLPLLFDIRLTHSATEETRKVFQMIDTLPAVSILLVSFDFEASTFAEIKPLAETLIRHALKRNHRIVGLSLFAEGTALGEQTLERLANENGKLYGSDYVYLGYRPQYMSAILAMGISLPKEFPLDYFGDSTSTMPIFSGVENYQQIAAVLSIADGGMPAYWVQFAVTPYNVSLLTAVTATMATSYYPYLSSGQMKGMLAGLKGAAEYEDLLKESGGGGRGLFAQSVAQLVIVGVIIAGNVAERIRRRRQ